MGLPASFLRHTGDGDGPAEGPAAPAEAEVPAPGVIARAVARARAERATRPGSLRHTVNHGRASTRAEHRSYVRSRTWAPRPGGFWDWEGRIFYAVFGSRFHDLSLLLEWVSDRQWRTWCALLVLLTVVLPPVLWLHHVLG